MVLYENINELEKEIDNETELTTEQKQDLKKTVQETSGRFDTIKSELSKYGGKFTGNLLHTFVGLD